jgi:hypothetical protein
MQHKDKFAGSEYFKHSLKRQELQTKVLFLYGKPIKRPRNRRGDHIKVYIKEIRFESVDWIHLAQNRIQWASPVDSVTKFRVPKMQYFFLPSE